MARCKPIPMPIEAVLHSRHMQCAAGPVHRAILTVACHYWASGAPLAGIEEETARQVSRIASGHWNAIKAAVMPALADILPELATSHAIALEKRENMKRSIEAGQLKGRIVMFERRQRQKAATVEKSPAVHRTPKTAARYVDETNPMTPQALAALPKREAEGARMADK